MNLYNGRLQLRFIISANRYINLSPEFKLKHPEIILNIVSGLRHRLVHDYDGVNWSVIVEVVFGEMDQFIDSEKTYITKAD